MSELSQLKDQEAFVRIIRKNEYPLNGFILSSSDEFILLQVCEDFLFDGFAIINLDDVEKIEPDDTLKYKEILQKEGCFKLSYDIAHKVCLESWPKIFESIKALDSHVILENDDPEVEFFEVGQIKDIMNDKIEIKSYGPDGVFYAENSLIPYPCISIIKFLDRYTTTFRKYLSSGL